MKIGEFYTTGVNGDNLDHLIERHRPPLFISGSERLPCSKSSGTPAFDLCLSADFDA